MLGISSGWQHASYTIENWKLFCRLDPPLWRR